jgi:hypothetical protein
MVISDFGPSDLTHCDHSKTFILTYSLFHQRYVNTGLISVGGSICCQAKKLPHTKLFCGVHKDVSGVERKFHHKP